MKKPNELSSWTPWLLALSFSLAAPSLAEAPSKEKEAPSKVENAVKEGDLPTLKLTPQAVKRLALAAAPIEKKPMPTFRLYMATVLPPLAGQEGIAPMPPTTPDDWRKLAEQQAAADGLVASAQVAVEAAEIARQRAERLAKDKAGSERALDEARAQEKLARANLATAEAQRKLLGQPVSEALRSPLRWAKVSVSSLELASLDTKATGRFRGLGGSSAGIDAKPVSAPPSANDLAGAVDLFYEFTAPQNLVLGSKAGLEIPKLGANEDALLVPLGAILRDAQGGEWVYERSAPETFRRRRVQVARVVQDKAVLSAGPAAGTQVIVTGAAELFGAEFGGFK